MAKTVNGIKFVTYEELRDHLNNYIAEHHMYEPNKSGVPMDYTLLQIMECWACARQGQFMTTGKKVEEGVHYIKGEGGEHLLSLEGVKLIHKFGHYDGHNAPMLNEGAELLFEVETDDIRQIPS